MNHMFKTLFSKTAVLISTASPAMCFAAGIHTGFIFFYPQPITRLSKQNMGQTRRATFYKGIYWRSGKAVAWLLQISGAVHLTEGTCLIPLLYSPLCLHLDVLIPGSLTCPHFSRVHPGTSPLNISSGVRYCIMARRGRKVDSFW